MTNSTDFYPANHLPRSLYQREDDMAAGIEVGPDFRRFDQKDDIFCRAFWDETVRSDASMEFFRSHGHSFNSRNVDGFTQRDFALRNAAWSVADDYADRNRPNGLREGFQDPQEARYPPAEQRFPVEDAAAMPIEIK